MTARRKAPPASVRRLSRDEHAAGRPSTAHMLATGSVVLPRDPVVDTLCREATAFFTTPLSERRQLGHFTAERTIEADGFFEWESEPAAVADADVEAGGVGPGDVEAAEVDSADVYSVEMDAANGEGCR